MSNLYTYFGIVGIASILCWLSAWAVALRFPPAWSGVRRTSVAATIAAAGLLLALLNSSFVSAIGVDRSAEEAAALAAQRAARERHETEERHRTRQLFAEESPEEARALARQDRPETAAEQTYSYRAGGKQDREAGKQLGEKDAVVPQVAETEVSGRKLPEAQKIQADHLDRLNLVMARCTAAALLLLLVFRYLRALNLTFPTVWSLPLTGRWLDSLQPKFFRVIWQNAGRRDRGPFLRRLLARGETFIYVGQNYHPHDEIQLRLMPPIAPMASIWRWLYLTPINDAPWPVPAPAAAAVRRWSPTRAEQLDLLWTALQRAGRRVLRRLPVCVMFCIAAMLPLLIFCRFVDGTAWYYVVYLGLAAAALLCVDTPLADLMVRQLHLDAETRAIDLHGLLASIWFGRACAVVRDDNAAFTAEFVRRLNLFLHDRRLTGATTRRSVNIVWDCALPATELLAELGENCANTNTRLILVTGESLPELQPDEVYIEPTAAMV